MISRWLYWIGATLIFVWVIDVAQTGTKVDPEILEYSFEFLCFGVAILISGIIVGILEDIRNAVAT
jgi:uncharacterized membrane protein (DUF106 family)